MGPGNIFRSRKYGAGVPSTFLVFFKKMEKGKKTPILGSTLNVRNKRKKRVLVLRNVAKCIIFITFYSFFLRFYAVFYGFIAVFFHHEGAKHKVFNLRVAQINPPK